MNTSQENQELLQLLRDKLPHGSNMEIILRSGYSSGTVSRTLNGKIRNQKVLDVALEIIKEVKAKDDELKQVLTTSV